MWEVFVYFRIVVHFVLRMRTGALVFFKLNDRLKFPADKSRRVQVMATDKLVYVETMLNNCPISLVDMHPWFPNEQEISPILQHQQSITN